MTANACTSPGHSISVIPAHSDDHISWLSRSPPVLRIDCKEGIGSATIKTYSDWPETLQVELELAALEGFIVRAANEVHRLEYGKSGHVLVEPEQSGVLHMSSFRAIESGQRFRLSLQLGELAEPVHLVHIEWVDFYR